MAASPCKMRGLLAALFTISGRIPWILKKIYVLL